MKTLGFDEVGRGCLCGPVTAACVMFPHNVDFNTNIFEDSKSISLQKRNVLAKLIRTKCMWGLGWVYPHNIDKINIHNASLLAMQNAFINIVSYMQSTQNPRERKYNAKDFYALIDGKYCPILKINNVQVTTKAIIKGDTLINEIKAASILAKTTRDAHITLLGNAFPYYGLSAHKGYPTSYHKKAIELYGINSSYRKSFKLPPPHNINFKQY